MSLDHVEQDAAAWTPTQELDWDAVYADQLPRIYNYFRFRLGNAADAEDLTSRTFEKAWRSRARYRRDLAGFATWWFRIAHNVCVDHLRSVRAHLPIDTALATSVDAACVSRIVTVKNVPAMTLVPLLRPLLPQHAHLAAASCGNTVLIVDTMANIRRIEQLIRARRSQYASALSGWRQLNSSRSKDGAKRSMPA